MNFDELKAGDLVEYRDTVRSETDGRVRMRWVTAVVQRVGRAGCVLSVTADAPVVQAWPYQLRPSPIPELRAVLNERAWEYQGQMIYPQVKLDSAGYTVLWLDRDGNFVTYDELGATASEARGRVHELKTGRLYRGRVS